MADKTTTIRVTFSTKKDLDGLGSKGDTYDDVIQKLIKTSKEEVKKK